MEILFWFKGEKNMGISKVYQCSEEQFIEFVKKADSFAECCRFIGLSDKGGNGPNKIKQRCEELGITTDHFTRRARHQNKAKYSLEEILVENSDYTSTNHLKKRLLREQILEYKCALCGNTGEWNGKPLSLVLDHINGEHSDNRLENLRILCPNCHSQTDTFAGKNKNKNQE